jgi:hypothetical protein
VRFAPVRGVLSTFTSGGSLRARRPLAAVVRFLATVTWIVLPECAVAGFRAHAVRPAEARRAELESE